MAGGVEHAALRVDLGCVDGGVEDAFFFEEGPGDQFAARGDDRAAAAAHPVVLVAVNVTTEFDGNVTPAK